MSRYILVRRLRGPAFLLLVGVIALLAQAHILGWGKSWPLFLILWGVQLLAERAALAMDGGVYPGVIDPATTTGIPQYPGQPVANYPGQPAAIVPAHLKDPNGGQS